MPAREWFEGARSAMEGIANGVLPPPLEEWALREGVRLSEALLLGAY